MSNFYWIIGLVVSVVVIVGGLIIVVCVCNKRSKAEENRMRLAARMSGLEEDIEVSQQSQTLCYICKKLTEFHEIPYGGLFNAV